MLQEMTIGEIFPQDSMPVGYRFHPNDQEIVGHFLKNKILGNDNLVGAIPEVDICKHEPWELPYFSVVKSDDPEWFFFSTLDFKFCNGGRLNRKTKKGFWKPTGNDKKIKARRTNIVIGTRKTLVFHEGRVRDAVRTNWMLYEYHSVSNNHSRKPIYVVCRLMKREDEKVEDDTADYDSQTRPNGRAITEMLPEENGDSAITTLPLQEPNSEDIRHFWIQMLPEENGDSANTKLPLQEPNSEDSNWTEIMKFVDSATVDGWFDETNNPSDRDNHFMQSQWNAIDFFDYGRDTDLQMARSRSGDLPPNMGECSSWTVQPQMRMFKLDRTMEGKSMLQSHLWYVEHEKILRRNEFSGQANSGRAASRIRLQRGIGNTPGNPIKAEEASKYSPNDHPKKNQVVTRPPSEYFANFVIGIVLIIAFVRETVIYGQWGM